MRKLFNKPFNVLLFFTLLICSCKEDDGEISNPTPTDSYTSQLVENSGWSTVAYDDQVFSGQPFTSFYYEHEYAISHVYQNTPIFLTYSHFLNTSGYRFKTLSYTSIEGNKAVKDDTKAIGPLQQSENYPFSNPTVPDNIKKLKDTRYSYNPLYNHLFFEGEHYAQLNYYVSGRKTSLMGVMQDTDTYGWVEGLSKSMIQEKIDLDYISNGTAGAVETELGHFDFANLDGEKTMVHFATFTALEKGGSSRRKYGCLAAKKRNSKDSIDYISTPFFISDDHEPSSHDLITIGDNFAVVLEHVIYFGNFKDNLTSIYSLPNGFELNQIIKTDDFSFLIYSSNLKKGALRISSTGEVKDFGFLPEENILSYACYRGDLIFGYATEEATIKIRKLTATGIEMLGVETTTKPLTENRYNGVSLCLGSDNENLYAAIKNNLSAKFKGDKEQWTAWEIIKYDLE